MTTEASVVSGVLSPEHCEPKRQALRSTRICYLASASDPHTAKWVNYFSSKGYEVHVLSFEDARGFTPDVVVHKLRTRWPSSLRYFTVTHQLKRLIAEIQPALLHAHYAAGYGTLGRLARFHPYIVSVWGKDVFDVPTKSPLHRLLIERNLASATHVCSTSRFMADHTHQYYNGLITLTPFGVDCSRFKPYDLQPPEPHEFVIGTVKKLEEKYGIEFLIRSFALLLAKYKGSKKVRLVIAGEGSLKEKLQRLARECGVGELTQFLGFVPNDRVPELLNSFSVFVALSISDSESFGVAVVEASACGIPVVISNVPGMCEVVQNGITGLVVPRQNPEAASDAILRLIGNEGFRRELGTAGRKFVMQNYEWSENASRMERLYQSILGWGRVVNHGTGELTCSNY